MDQLYSDKNRDRVTSFRRVGLSQLRTLFITAVLLSLSVLPARSQGTFFNLYGSAVTDHGDRMIAVPGGGYVFAGATDAPGFGGTDIAVTRVDASGNILWCRKIGTTDDESVGNLVAIPGGGFYVVMTMSDPAWTANATTAVLKLDANGGVVWTREFSSVSHAHGEDILATSAGGFVLLTTDDSAGYTRPKIVACDSNGTVAWSKIYFVPGACYAPAIIECSNGDFALACSVWDTINDWSVTLWRIDNAGNLLWCKQSQLGSLPEYLHNIIYANEEIFAETWRHDSIRVNCFSASGVPLWTKGITTPFGMYYGRSHAEYSNGKILIVSPIINISAGNYSGLIAELDTTGTLLNSGVLHYGANTYLKDATYNSNGNWVLCGTVVSGFSANDTSSVFLAAGDPQNGTLCGYTSIPFSVHPEPALPSTSLNISVVNSSTTSALTMQTSTGTIMQIGCIVGIGEERTPQAELYPNPVSDMLTISTTSTSSTFHLFNSQGQSVMMNNLTGDRNEITVGGLPPGIYYYRLEAESGEVSSGKLVVH